MVEVVRNDLGVKAITQVSLVVKDVEKVVQNYWNILGIGPWQIKKLYPPYLNKRTLRGKPAYFEFKTALCKVGNLQLELIQNIEGETEYSNFLAKHGEGVHHIQYMVDNISDIDRHASILASHGIGSVMSGCFEVGGAFHYFDAIPQLKTILEIVKYGDFSGTITTYPADPDAVSPARIKVDSIYQISYAVKDLEEAMANYVNILSIGPWNIMDVVPPDYYNPIYRGKPGRHTMRAGLCTVNGVEIELIQGLSGDNIYSDFICQHGEGINHLGFMTDNIERVTDIMAEEGFMIAQGGNHLDGAYCYFDTTGPLKVMWEAFRPPKKMPVSARFP